MGHNLLRWIWFSACRHSLAFAVAVKAGPAKSDELIVGAYSLVSALLYLAMIFWTESTFFAVPFYLLLLAGPVIGFFMLIANYE